MILISIEMHYLAGDTGEAMLIMIGIIVLVPESLGSQLFHLVKCKMHFNKIAIRYRTRVYIKNELLNLS